MSLRRINRRGRIHRRGRNHWRWWKYRWRDFKGN
jgi:hypothetical protein